MGVLRKMVAAVLCAAALCGLQACAPAAEPQRPRGAVVRLAAPQSNYIEDFDTNWYKLWLEEQTGLTIEMTWLPQEDAEQIAHQQLTTGEGMPDAYIGFGGADLFKPANIVEYAELGRVVPLTALVETQGAHVRQVFHELDEFHVKELITSPDGEIYSMPGFSYSLITRYSQVMWVNRGWLDALGLEVPKTTEDFRAMLEAFAARDPNGNGFADEIPMAGTEQAYSKQCYDFLINAFVYNDPKNTRLTVEEGVVGFAPTTAAWRDAMRYLRGLYADGLFWPLSFEQDEQQLIQMANDPRDILGAFTSSGVASTLQQDSPAVMSRFVGIAPLTGPGGVRFATVSTPLPKPSGVITSACEHPELVFQLFDFMLSEQACLIGRYGEPGVDWDFAAKGQTSIYGTPATIDIKNQIWNTLQNKHLQQLGPYVSRAKYSGGVTFDGNTVDGEYMNAQAALQYRDAEPGEYVAALLYTREENARAAELRKGITAYMQQSIRAFVTGEKDIGDDAVWQAYLDGYQPLRLDEFLRLAQTAHNRMERPAAT